MQQVHRGVFLGLRRTFQMSAHATIAQNFPRVTLECDNCHLVQFETASKRCRKCHAPYAKKETAAPLPEAIDRPAPAGRSESGVGTTVSSRLAASIRAARHSAGLSQRQLAVRMKVPRTYISKIENEYATPTLGNFERLAAALDLPPAELLASRGNDCEIRALMTNPFLAEIAPLVASLSSAQRDVVLEEVRRMSLRA